MIMDRLFCGLHDCCIRLPGSNPLLFCNGSAVLLTMYLYLWGTQSYCKQPYLLLQLLHSLCKHASPHTLKDTG